MKILVFVRFILPNKQSFQVVCCILGGGRRSACLEKKPVKHQAPRKVLHKKPDHFSVCVRNYATYECIF